jgi:hypothetical protein
MATQRQTTTTSDVGTPVDTAPSTQQVPPNPPTPHIVPSLALLLLMFGPAQDPIDQLISLLGGETMKPGSKGHN